MPSFCFLHGFWISEMIISLIMGFMSKVHAAELPKKPSSINTFHAIKNNRRMRTKTKSPDRNILQHIFHPDYILFDWEFFSRELEFE